MGDRRAAWLLFGLFLCVFLLTSGGHFYSADGGKEYEVTRAIVTRGAVDVPQPFGLPGRDGKFYPPHAAGQSIVWIPFYAAGALLERAGFGAAAHGLAASSLNALASAATAALLFLIARALGASPPGSAALSLTYGFATMAWVYSKNTFDVVLAGALVTAALLLLLRAQGSRKLSTFAFAGAALGWAGVTRVPTLVLWPIAGLVVLTFPGEGRLRRLAAFGAPLIACLGVVLAYNYLRFGDVLDDGHKADTATAFTGNVLEGIAGFLVSPARGIVFFAPLVLVAGFGWNALRRRRAWVAWFALAAFAATLASYAPVQGWQGGFSWGPRFLFPVLAVTVMPAVLVFDRWPELPGLARAAVEAAVLIGFFLTVPGVLADYQVQTLLQEEKGVRITRVWELSNAAYVYHGEVLDDIARDRAPFPRAKAESGRPPSNTWDFWWWYAVVQRRAVALVAVVVAGLAGAAVWFGRRVAASVT